MIAVLDRAPHCGLADQSPQLLLAVEQRSLAQVVVAAFQQVEGDKGHLATAPSTTQRIEVRCAVIVENDSLAGSETIASEAVWQLPRWWGSGRSSRGRSW
jgi:hypothetical protein